MRQPPRKLSVENGLDNDNADALNVRLFLNEEQQNNCVAYDLDKQQIRRYALGPNGQPKLDRVKGELEIETVEGDVRVEWIDPSKVE